MNYAFVIVTSALSTASALRLPPAFNVFTPGESGIEAFRIPGLLAFPSNSSRRTVLLAYAEGRVFGCGDFDGTHSIVSKRSIDGGRTWSELITLMDPIEMFGREACPPSKKEGCEFWDPTAVYDRQTGDIHLLAALSTSASQRMSGHLSLYALTSHDGGVSWSRPRNITHSVRPKPDDGCIFTPGNGHATQLASGRLLMAGYRRPAGDSSEHCTTISSDDHGRTWHLQPIAAGSNLNGTSECEVAEVGDVGAKRVVMDERMNGDEQQRRGGCGHGVAKCRWHSESSDGGETWSGPEPVPALIDPSNAAGICEWYTRSSDALIFVNTASQTQRVNVTLRVSLDAGRTWPARYTTLVSGPGGYSDVQLLPNLGGRQDYAAVLYEKDTCNGIALSLVPLPLPVEAEREDGELKS